MKTASSILTAAFLALSSFSYGQTVSQTWNPDKGTHYMNPVLNADYSDPDVCRMGDDFYMTSSSFNCFPGLQILHSKDLVNWEIVGAALRDYPGKNWSDERPWEVLGMDLGMAGTSKDGGSWAGGVMTGGAGKSQLDVPGPEEWKTTPQHGNGVWAPAIRHHNGEFYIYCGDPDRGIFMVKTDDPRGRWEDPVWVVKAKGYIDPCPFWDEDGRAYLSHGCAGSRAGTKSVLFVAPMSPDGTRLLDDSRIVYDGHITQPTIEGTKFYKRDGYYYIFSPAGGVPTGWQVVLRSSNPFGPYEERVVMAEGDSCINGPHQGAWVSTASGEDWFMHFQDKDAYGRVVHLQPMEWGEDGWPVIGEDADGDGVGKPVLRYRKPVLKGAGVFQPAESDEFEGATLGLQWQWYSVPSPYWWFLKGAAERPDDGANDRQKGTEWDSGVLRLYSVHQTAGWKNLGDTPNLLLQKTPADSFTATAKVRFIPNPQLKSKDENCGLVLMGADYAALKLTDGADGISLQYIECFQALKGGSETVVETIPLDSYELPEPYSRKYLSTTVPPPAAVHYVAADVYLRIKVRPEKRKGDTSDMTATFWYSLDGKRWNQLGNAFVGTPGKWIGAKFGFFCNRHSLKNDSGWMEIDWLRVTE